MVHKALKNLSYDYIKPKSNTLDAAHSILRNIAEGYCRKSPKEYLNFLNYALVSSGKLNSGMIGFRKKDIISEEAFENFDIFHYKTNIPSQQNSNTPLLHYSIALI